MEPLGNLPSGSDVFLDANIFIYALCNQSSECLTLLQRCAREEVFGITTVDLLNETTHRLMLAEACARGIISKEKASSLRRRLSDIRDLGRYWQQMQAVLGLNLIILETKQTRLHKAHAERANYGLLTNDSLIVAAMREYGITNIASADADFDHIPGLTRYRPTDLPGST